MYFLRITLRIVNFTIVTDRFHEAVSILAVGFTIRVARRRNIASEKHVSHSLHLRRCPESTIVCSGASRSLLRQSWTNRDFTILSACNTRRFTSFPYLRFFAARPSQVSFSVSDYQFSLSSRSIHRHFRVTLQPIGQNKTSALCP